MSHNNRTTNAKLSLERGGKMQRKVDVVKSTSPSILCDSFIERV